MSLKFLRLTPSTALTGTGAQTAVAIEETPFAPGFNAVAVVQYVGGTGTPVVQIQASPDGTNWTTLAATDGLVALQQQWFNIEIPADTIQLRSNKSAAGSAGTFDVVLLGAL